MANYDRRILVPYLQDVCSVELTCAQMENDIYQCERDISSLNNERKEKEMVKPVIPVKEERYGIEWPILVAPVVIGIILGFFGYVGNGGGSGNAIMACIVFLIGVCVSVALLIRQLINNWKLKKDDEEIYQNRMARYENDIRKYNDNIGALAALDMKIRNLHNVCDEKKRVFQKATSVRNKVYSVNIIPNQYRNIYAAYYLYDFMSTSRETDLEKVIQTFVLEEIKQRLEKIIMQNDQVLINQRVQLAMQEQQNRMVAENHREELRGIARLEANQERQLDYQKMITANQEVTNYILAEDYFRKYDKRIPY